MNIRKQLGQNFLNSKSIAKFIVNSANISKNDVVYEIGIGKGILIPFLCELSKNVISVEKDFRLYEECQQKFSNLKRRSQEIKHSGDPSGESIVATEEFVDSTNNRLSIYCTDWTEKLTRTKNEIKKMVEVFDKEDIEDAVKFLRKFSK